LTEEERQRRLLTQDYKMQGVKIENITEVIYDPAFVPIVEAQGQRDIR